MSFSVRVVRSDGEPAEDVGVMIDYGILSGGCDEKRTDSDGWVEFRNHGEKPGTIWVHGEKMGDHSLASISTRNNSVNTIGVFGDKVTTQAN